MNNFEFRHNGKTFIRINKRQAINEFMHGNTVIISACNVRPFNAWYFGYMEYSKTICNQRTQVIDYIGYMNAFKNQVSSFEYYNCTNSNTGKYASFYIEKKENRA